MNNYFQCAPKQLLTQFFKEKSLCYAAKTENGHNTRSISCCSATRFAMRQVDCVNEPAEKQFPTLGPSETLLSASCVVRLLVLMWVNCSRGGFGGVIMLVAYLYGPFG